MSPSSFNDAARAESALSFIPAGDRELWIKIGMALKAGLGEDGFALFDRWSQTAASYNAKAAHAVWKSIKTGAVGFATLFYEARQHSFDSRQYRRALPVEHVRRHSKPRWLTEAEQIEAAVEHRAVAKLAAELWTNAESASDTHPYLICKSVKAYGLRRYRGQLTIGGMACDGALIIPARNANDALTTLQFINGEGVKRFLAGGKKSGSFCLIGEPGPILCLAEGYATAASIHQATGYPVVVAFDAGNLYAAATALKAKFPNTQWVICADDDTETVGNPGLSKATAVACQIGARVAMPRSVV